MTHLTLDYLLAHAGAYSVPLGADPETTFTSITNDSRVARPGALFLALEAERDGHDFIADARARGAVGALARRVVPLADPAGFAYVVVPDPIEACRSTVCLCAPGRSRRMAR